MAGPQWAEAFQRRPLTPSHRSAGRGPSFLPPSSFSGAGVSARVKFRSDLDNRRDPVWPGSLWALGPVERRSQCSRGRWPHQPKGHLVCVPTGLGGLPTQGTTRGLFPTRQFLLTTATVQGPQNSHAPNYSPTAAAPFAPSLWATPHLGKPGQPSERARSRTRPSPWPPPSSGPCPLELRTPADRAHTGPDPMLPCPRRPLPGCSLCLEPWSRLVPRC